jgi:hypothetical protein
MSGLSRFFCAGLVAAAALVSAPQVSYAVDGIGGWSTAPKQYRNGTYCDGYGSCTRGGREVAPPEGRAKSNRRVTVERTRKHRDVRQHEWRNDGWNNRRYEKRHYRNSPDVFIDLQIGRPQYYEPRYVPRYAPHRTIVLSQSHVNWCYNRYISYRDWDNSWQPYNGPRKQCYSPYS